jgi:chemotaxis methyl-accepting protein methylase
MSVSFFAEPHHLTKLHKEAQRWVDAGLRCARVWCAGGSTGEEPYTLAIVLADVLRGTPVDFRVLATDTSRRALAFAAQGRYPVSRLEQVPPELRARYFEPDAAADGAERVVSELRRRVIFKRLDLTRARLPLRGGLNAVFCERALWDLQALERQRVSAEVERLIAPDGLLVGVEGSGVIAVGAAVPLTGVA